jgi:hypothetical protein
MPSKKGSIPEEAKQITRARSIRKTSIIKIMKQAEAATRMSKMHQGAD